MEIEEFNSKLNDNSILSSGMTFKQEVIILYLQKRMIDNDINWEEQYNALSDRVSYKKVWLTLWKKENLGNSFDSLMNEHQMQELLEKVKYQDMNNRILIFLKCQQFTPYTSDSVPNLNEELFNGRQDLAEEYYNIHNYYII